MNTIALQPTARAKNLIKKLGLQNEYPFKHNFIQTAMGSMHYLDEGSGNPILMLHGNPTWSYLYRNFVNALSGNYRTVVPDHIGFGLSDKPTELNAFTIDAHIRNLETLITELDLRDITVVMQDWGGPIGLGAAARNPERFKALVIMNTFGFYPPVDGMNPDKIKLPAPLLMMRTNFPGKMLVKRFGMFEKIAMPTAIAGKQTWKQVKRAYTGVFEKPADRTGVLAFPRLIPTQQSHPSAQILLKETGPYLEKFNGPAKIFWGVKDPFFPIEALEAWKKRLPQASVTELPNGKHYIQEDSTSAVIPQLEVFLNSM